MKRLTCLTVILCILFAMPVASANEDSSGVFTVSDLIQITDELNTVEDYASLIQPAMYSWMYVDGKTQLELMAADGSAVLEIDTGSAGINGEEYGSISELDENILELEAKLLSATWFESRYALPVIRDVGIGSPKQAVLDAFTNNGSPLYSVDEVAAGADTASIPEWAYVGGDIFSPDEDNELERIIYGWCDFSIESAERTYYTLSYEIKDGAVFTIEFFSVKGD